MPQISSQILRFDSLPSTNLEAAKRAIAGAAEGACIVADEQTAGRGREGRTWTAPVGRALLLSLGFRQVNRRDHSRRAHRNVSR